jgi:hypothetical protein
MEAIVSASKIFHSFAEFYSFCSNDHRNRTCERLHCIGSSPVPPMIEYGFAWTGHFGYEKHCSATVRHLLYNLIGNWVVFKDRLTGRIRF